MKVLEIVGIILFIFGIIFCAWPNLVIKLNQLGQRLVFTDEGTVKHNLKTGIIFMVVGAIIFFLNRHYGRILSR